MIRFAVIGYDHAHLPRYVPALAAHPEIELVALVAPGLNRSLANRDAEEFGCRYFEDLGVCLDSVAFDAAYIGAPPDRHREICAELAPRGIHILCDKPIAITLSDADAIIAQAEHYGIRLMVPFNPRYQMPVQRLKAMIDGGELGELQHLHATKFGRIPRGIPDLDTSWFFDRSQAGFGGFGDIGIHAIDALRWLSGGEARQVYARINRLVHNDIDIDDFGSMIIEFDNGVVASQQSGWINPTGSQSWLSVSFDALGTLGSASIDKPYHDLEISDLSRTERLPWWRADVSLLIAEFVNAIKQERQPAITGSDARAALAILTAAYQSAQTGQPVTVS